MTRSSECLRALVSILLRSKSTSNHEQNRFCHHQVGSILFLSTFYISMSSIIFVSVVYRHQHQVWRLASRIAIVTCRLPVLVGASCVLMQKIPVCVFVMCCTHRANSMQEPFEFRYKARALYIYIYTHIHTYINTYIRILMWWACCTCICGSLQSVSVDAAWLLVCMCARLVSAMCSPTCVRIWT